MRSRKRSKMSGGTGVPLANAWPRSRRVRLAARLRPQRPFSDAEDFGTPQAKTSGIFGDPRLLRATFGDWRCDGQKTKKSSNTAKTQGLQGDKVVSAEGIE